MLEKSTTHQTSTQSSPETTADFVGDFIDKRQQIISSIQTWYNQKTTLNEAQIADIETNAIANLSYKLDSDFTPQDRRRWGSIIRLSARCISSSS